MVKVRIVEKTIKRFIYLYILTWKLRIHYTMLNFKVRFHDDIITKLLIKL